MKNERTQQIADALRSGQYQQGRSMLAQVIRRDPKGPAKVLYCCVGVMCELTPGISKDNVNERLSGYIENVLADHRDISPEENWTEADVVVSEEELPLYYDGNHEMPPLRVHEWIGLSTTGLGISPPLYLDSGEVTFGNGAPLTEVSLDMLNDTWQFAFDQIGDLIAYFGLTNEASRD